MQLGRVVGHRVGLVDISVAVVVVVMLVLPPREMVAAPAYKQADHFKLGLIEARSIANPDDPTLVVELARRLGEAGFRDWAVESAIHGANRTSTAPGNWRALLATSVAYVDQLDVHPALDYAKRALTACEEVAKTDSTACPEWEEIRTRAYFEHLEGGVKSGIDPRRDPMGFRKAGEDALRLIRLGGQPVR
ncbi:MAG: hypothetical protein WKG01_24110 [Kofleriaceae bacterium]